VHAEGEEEAGVSARTSGRHGGWEKTRIGDENKNNTVATRTTLTVTQSLIDNRILIVLPSPRPLCLSYLSGPITHSQSLSSSSNGGVHVHSVSTLANAYRFASRPRLTRWSYSSGSTMRRHRSRS
jgi:hypothetical protein